MSNISIIGVGRMARALGVRALDGGNTVEIIGRDPAKAAGLAGNAFAPGATGLLTRDATSAADSLGLRPLDAGPLAAAGRLEQAALLMMGLARYGTGHYNFAFGITDFG